MLLSEEIADERSVEHLGIEVLAPSGWVKITHVCRTIPMRVWALRTQNHALDCAGKHLVIDHQGRPVPADQLRPGDLVLTESGVEAVTLSESQGDLVELYDLRVDSADHVYFTGGIASHNSTGLGAAELFKGNTIPGYRSLYIAPLKEQTKTFADKLMDMQRGSKFPPDYILGKGLRNNMYYKEFAKGGSLKLLHVLTDVSKVRGNSSGTVVIDECVVSGSKIATYDYSGKIVDLVVEKLSSGAHIPAHDAAGNIVTDIVVRVVNKGLRPVWTLSLVGGKSLTCTSNEKLRTTHGWVFLSQLLPDSEVSRCERAQQIQSVIRDRQEHADREHAGGRLGGVGGGSEPKIPIGARTESGSVFESQSGIAERLRDDAAEVVEEPWLRYLDLQVSNSEISSVRISVLSDDARSSRQTKPTKGGHQSVGGHAELGSDCLLAYGRRHATGEAGSLYDARFLAVGNKLTGRQAAGVGPAERSDEGNQEEQQVLPHHHASDRGRASHAGEHAGVCAPVDDLQVGARHQAPHVQLLPGGVRNRTTCENQHDHYSRVLHEGHVPPPDGEGPKGEGCRAESAPHASAAQSQVREGYGVPQGRPGALLQVEGLQQGEATGEIYGPTEDCKTQGLEESLAGGEEVRGDYLPSEPDAHLHLLRDNFQQQRGPQDGQAQPLHQLPSGSLHDAQRSQPNDREEPEGQGEGGVRQGRLVEDSIASITYAGVQEVWDVETEKHHTLFVGGIAVHNCQDFDADHLPEIAQVQKAFRDSKCTIMAGTSKDIDTCLEHQYQQGSRGVWNIQCTCPMKWHPLDDREMIPKMMSVDGLRCPINHQLLNPMLGEFVHEDARLLAMNQVSFHLPQVIVPEYASGTAFMDIWRDFQKFPYKKFLQEVMGIAVDSGMTELTEMELKACCSDKTFAQLQADYLSDRTRYVYVFSGCDWGGSDWNPATRTKQSYTVHSIYGLTGDGVMELIYAHRYAEMNYQEIAGTIVEAHNRFKCFGIGTDNGGGSYYNAYMRDCGRIATDRVITFNYSDTKLILDRIPHPDAHIFSLHRSDSLSALINDVKTKRIRFPRWDDSQGFVTDFLNMRRNITESPSGKSIMRYVRHGSKADDFMQSTNYACMLKRIITRESMIPNQQVLDELASMFGTAPIQMHSSEEYLGIFGGGYVGG